jgi:UDP-3-O-[3-hydroxymyristoyl] glucosamine N-acyltransferase
VQPQPFTPGVHPTAVIGEGVQFDPAKVRIAPHAVIEDGVVIADGVEIGAGCFVGRNARIGAGAKLFANVTVHTGCLLGQRVILHSGVVIGADGFGYEFDKGRHRKVRQAGIVQIDDEVEIGAGSMVDRARFGRTWIGEGTKIDNLVQIGHNVVIGKHCIIVAATAIAGSAQIGDYVVIAAQCGIAGHVKIGSQATLAARCGVTKDLPGGAAYMGFPAIPVHDERRRLAGINRLPNLTARVKKLEADTHAVAAEHTDD